MTMMDWMTIVEKLSFLILDISTKFRPSKSIVQNTFYVKDSLVLERDNQGLTDAAVKRMYRIDLNVELEGQVIEKELVTDLIDIYSTIGALPMEKIEGLAYTKEGVWILNDNDGLDDNSGETQLLNLGYLD